MKLNLTGGRNENILTSSVPLPVGIAPPDTNPLIVFPYGVAHGGVIVKDGANAPLVYGTDWEYYHYSKHAETTYDIEAYASIVILKSGLVGSISITANYLGGGYELWYSDRVSNRVPVIGGQVTPVPWDSKLDYEFATKSDIDTLPGGAIKTSLRDVADLLESLKEAQPSGINPDVVSSLVTPMVNSYQDLTSAILDTNDIDIVNSINLVNNIVVGAVDSTIWDHEAKFQGLISTNIDLSRQIFQEPVFYRVWTDSCEVTQVGLDNSVNVVTLTRGNIIYFYGDNTNHSLVITGKDQPLTQLNRVDDELLTSRKDVSGAILELLELTEDFYGQGNDYPIVTTDSDFTNYVATGDYQLIPIGANVTITGKFRDSSVSKECTPEHVVVLYPDGGLVRTLANGYPSLYSPAINPLYTTGDLTVSGKVSEAASTMAKLGPQTGHVITVVNQGVAPKDSLDLQQGVVSLADNATLHELLDAAYGSTVNGAVMPPVASNNEHGTFVKFFTIPNSVVHCVAYNPSNERYIIHRIEDGQWTYLTVYNAADDSYANLPTMVGVDIVPAQMSVANNMLYLAQANKVNQLNLTTNVRSTPYTHDKVIAAMAVNSIRKLIYVVDVIGDLFMVDTVINRTVKLLSNVDKNFCVLMDDILWVGQGNDLVQIKVDSVIDRETRTKLSLGFPTAVNTLNNTIVSSHSDLYQLEASGVISKLGGVSEMTSLTFDSLKHGFVGTKDDSLYRLVFQQTLKNFIKE